MADTRGDRNRRLERACEELYATTGERFKVIQLANAAGTSNTHAGPFKTKWLEQRRRAPSIVPTATELMDSLRRIDERLDRLATMVGELLKQTGDVAKIQSLNPETMQDETDVPGGVNREQSVDTTDPGSLTHMLSALRQPTQARIDQGKAITLLESQAGNNDPTILPMPEGRSTAAKSGDKARLWPKLVLQVRSILSDGAFLKASDIHNRFTPDVQKTFEKKQMFYYLSRIKGTKQTEENFWGFSAPRAERFAKGTLRPFLNMGEKAERTKIVLDAAETMICNIGGEVSVGFLISQLKPPMTRRHFRTRLNARAKSENTKIRRIREGIYVPRA